MAVNKLLRGLKNIHFAPYVAGEYATPVKILYAKAIESKLNYEGEQEWGDDRIIDSSSDYAGGEGTLKVLGLLKEEMAQMFGNKIVKGGIVVNSKDTAPVGAFLFERGKKKSKEKRLYVVYVCQCSPTGFSGETVEEGKAKSTIEEIDFTIGETDDGNIYHFVDTDDTSIDPDIKTKWFTKVQLPTDITLALEKEEVIQGDESITSIEEVNSLTKSK